MKTRDQFENLAFCFFRPFERTIVLQKDSSGHVGFVFKNGKINQIAKDTSAARFVWLHFNTKLPYLRVKCIDFTLHAHASHTRRFDSPVGGALQCTA